LAYISGIDALRQLMGCQDKDKVKISAKDYTVGDKAEYFHVGLKSKNVNNNSVYVCGNDVRKIHMEATVRCQDQ